METVSIATSLAPSAEELWRSVTRIEGVNYELGPFLRMTAPAGLNGATIADLEPGVPAGRSWLLLGGAIPIEYDDLCVVESSHHAASSSARGWQACRPGSTSARSRRPAVGAPSPTS